MDKYFLWLIFALFSGGCSNDVANGNSNKISNFHAARLSSCDLAKTGVLALDASTQPAQVLDLTAIGSMECISWSIQNQLLHLELANLAQVCASSYSAEVTTISNGIAVKLVGAAGPASTCIDRCSRSFAMDILVDALPSEIDISATDSAFVPGRVMVQQSSGSACHYYWWPSSPAPTPVRGSCGGAAGWPDCPVGSVCDGQADAGSRSESFCKPQCTADSDCLIVESCVAGLCQLGDSSSW